MENYMVESQGSIAMLAKSMMTIAFILISFFLFHNPYVRLGIFIVTPFVIFSIPVSKRL